MMPAPISAQAGARCPAEVGMTSLQGGVQWTIDRMVSVGYGLVYDYIFEQFGPYQRLQAEVLEMVETAAKATSPDRRAFQVLDIDCGPGNLTFVLAEAGFTVLGLEPYGALVELAREKRRARRLTNLAFSQAHVTDRRVVRDASFDHVVNVHSIYAHGDPEAVLVSAWRALKPGGHAIFVNHTAPVRPWPTFRDIQGRDGTAAALRCLLLWLLPHWLFEATRRRRSVPHYWSEDRFADNLRAVGFTVLETRRTFLNDASVLVYVKKEQEG
jgi:SAM-dependent methyltransferase